MKTNEEGFTFEISKLTYTHFLNILRYYQTSNAKYLSIFELKYLSMWLSNLPYMLLEIQVYTMGRYNGKSQLYEPINSKRWTITFWQLTRENKGVKRSPKHERGKTIKFSKLIAKPNNKSIISLNLHKNQKEIILQ